MNVPAYWSKLRAGGPERLAGTLGIFLAGFFLLPSGKSLNNVYYALVLAPALLLLRGADWRWLAASSLWRVAMLLLAYLTLSGLWSTDFHLQDWLHEAKALPYLGVYLAVLACVSVRSAAAFERLLRAAALAGVIGTVVSGVVFYARVPWPARLEYAAAVYNANEAATLVGSVLLVVLFHILPATRGYGRQAGWLAGALVLMAGIVLTGSRTPLAAALVCVVLGLVLQRRWRSLAALGVLALAIGTLVAECDAARQALARGDSYRIAIWQQFAQRVAARPWLGEGLLTDDATRIAVPGTAATTTRFLHPHSVYLATALYGGLPALLLLLGLAALGLRQAWGLTMRGEPVWLLALLFALLCMSTDGDRLLHAPRAIWFYLWLPIGALIGQQAARRAGDAPPPPCPESRRPALGRLAPNRPLKKGFLPFFNSARRGTCPQRTSANQAPDTRELRASHPWLAPTGR